MSKGRSAGSRKSPEDNLKSNPNSYRDDIAQSELTESKIENKSAIDIPHSEIKEPLTTHNSPLTNMEVHHHPEVEKKGLKEYLLEGLMIFIAVMMGFFAESYREHITENNRAKEYATTLYSDLKADTAGLDKYIKRINFAAANVDTLMQLLSVNDPKDIPSGKLYWYGLFGAFPMLFAPHDATLLEMKNSGSLRYFTKPAINRMVAEYDQHLQYFKTITEHEQGIYTEVRKSKALLFNFKYNDAANMVTQRIYAKYSRASIDSFINTNPPLLSTNKVIFNQFVELVRSRFLKNQAGYADTLRHNANELIGALKQEYSLDNE